MACTWVTHNLNPTSTSTRNTLIHLLHLPFAPFFTHKRKPLSTVSIFLKHIFRAVWCEHVLHIADSVSISLPSVKFKFVLRPYSALVGKRNSLYKSGPRASTMRRRRRRWRQRQGILSRLTFPGILAWFPPLRFLRSAMKTVLYKYFTKSTGDDVDLTCFVCLFCWASVMKGLFNTEVEKGRRIFRMPGLVIGDRFLDGINS